MVAVAELEAGEDDAKPALDFESEVDGLESDLSWEPDSDLPFGLGSVGPDWAELLERLSVR